MEEQKNETKVVDMQNAGAANQDDKKLTYEKLNAVAQQLYNENMYLKQEMKKMQYAIKSIDRLDYLLKIIEVDNESRGNTISFDLSFIAKCVDEIQKLIYPDESDDKENNSEDADVKNENVD